MEEKPAKEAETKPQANLFTNNQSTMFFNNNKKEDEESEKKPVEQPEQEEDKPKPSLFNNKPKEPIKPVTKDNTVSLFPIAQANPITENKPSRGLFDNKPSPMFDINNQSSLFPTKPVETKPAQQEQNQRVTDQSKLETENEDKKPAESKPIFGQGGSLFGNNNNNTLFGNNTSLQPQKPLVQSNVMEMDANDQKDAMDAYKNDSNVNKAITNTQTLPLANTTPAINNFNNSTPTPNTNPILGNFNSTNNQSTGQGIFDNTTNSQGLFNNKPDDLVVKQSRMFSFADKGDNKGAPMGLQQEQPANDAKSNNTPSHNSFNQNQSKASPSNNPFINSMNNKPTNTANNLMNMANSSNNRGMFGNKNLSRSPEQQGIKDYMSKQSKQPTGNMRMNQFSQSPSNNMFSNDNKPSGSLFGNAPANPAPPGSLFGNSLGGGLFNNNQSTPGQGGASFGNFNNNPGNSLFGNQGGAK